MPISPGTYLQRYEAIPLDGVMGRQNIRLTGYRSSFKGDGKTCEARKRTYYDLRNFILKRKRYSDGANGASHTYDQSGTFKSDLLKPTGTVVFDIDWLQPMFQGVGRPADFQRLFKIIDVYLTRADIDDDHFQWLGWTAFGWLYVPYDVQHFADELLGIDCRGFVGAYLNEHQPQLRDTKKDMSFSIDSYNRGCANFHKTKKGGQFIRIDEPADVRSGDILIKCNKGDGKRHVALVDMVGTVRGMGVNILTAESRGSSGLQPKAGELIRLSAKYRTGQNDRNWRHQGAEYNFILRPR